MPPWAGMRASSSVPRSPTGAGRLAVLDLRRLDEGAGQRLEVGRQRVALQVAQQLVEEEVVDVEDGVGGDEDGLVLVAHALVELEVLQPVARRRHETVLLQQGAGFGGEGAVVEAQVRDAVEVHGQRVVAVVVIGRQRDGYAFVEVREARIAHVLGDLVEDLLHLGIGHRLLRRGARRRALRRLLELGRFPALLVGGGGRGLQIGQQRLAGEEAQRQRHQQHQIQQRTSLGHVNLLQLSTLDFGLNAPPPPTPRPRRSPRGRAP